MTKNLKRNIIRNIRIDLVTAVFLAVCILLVVRLFTIQILDHVKYKALAYDQYWSSQVILTNRGAIYSSDGYPLAETQAAYLIYAEPEKIKDPVDTSDKLAQEIYEIYKKKYDILTKESTESEELKEMKPPEKVYEGLKEKFFSSLSSSLIWVSLGQIVTPTEKDGIEKKSYAGIGFQQVPTRYYPEGMLASHVLGFVAIGENGEPQGYYGIEGSLDGDLKGKSGRVREEKDALGVPILFGGYQKVAPIEGRDIYLTINRTVQYIVEKRLKEGVETYGAVGGNVIVMDPNTGEIIAMANYPTYDPAKFYLTGENIQRKNLSISETYEPGSVIKPFTVSAAIDLKKITPDTTYVDDGPKRYSDYVIDNWDGKHLGRMNIITLLQKSNNIGAAWVGHLVGAQKLSEYFKAFGFGEKTGVDLEGEDTGIIRDSKNWTDIDLATASFGQGISATPLQVLNAFNAIANGGYLLKPKIISKFIENGKTTNIPNKKIRKVISSETDKTMNELLIQAVSGGESKYFNLKNYVIAGKTGTAQIPVNGKYDANKSNTTFVGYLAGTKKFSMIIRLDRPSTSVYAAETAVPLWMQITEDLIKYYGIPPDSPVLRQ